MLDPRIYRAALVPALLALIVVAFSLKDQPRAIGTTIAPIAFDGPRAWNDLQALAREFPDRHPGGAGDEQLAAHTATQLRGLGFRVRTVARSARTIEGRRDVQTIIAERTGTLDRRIVVVAHRDATKPGSTAELSGTEGLLELARVFGAPRRTQHTLTLVSTSGSAGAAGASALPSMLPRDRIDAVLVLGDLASQRTRRPFVTAWSNDLGKAPLRLQRTVEEAVHAETDSDPGGSRTLTQVARFAAPATLGEQGPLNADGMPAVLLSATGERGPSAADPVSQARLQAFGSAALRAITALDGGPDEPSSTPAELIVRRKVVPGWAVRLFVAALLLAPIVAMIDASARVRRRHEPIAPWIWWVLGGALPFAVAAGFARLLGLTGLLTAPPAPVSPEALPPQAAGVVAVALVVVLCWLVARPWLVRAVGGRLGDPGSAGAATAVLLVLNAMAFVVWLGNPYAALLLVLALHLWLFTLLPELRPRRGLGILFVAVGIAPVAAVVASLMAAFGLGPIDAVWFGLVLVAGGHASPLAWLIWSILAACAGAAAAIAWRGRGQPEPPRGGGPTMSVRGPATYVGPGSLGGVESALRR
jgi:hypothetical protein